MDAAKAERSAAREEVEVTRTAVASASDPQPPGPPSLSSECEAAVVASVGAFESHRA